MPHLLLKKTSNVRWKKTNRKNKLFDSVIFIVAHMNKKSIEYKVYKALLESNLSYDQQQLLIEAGFLEKIADFFGAGADTLSTNIKKIFNDNKFARRSARSKQAIEKELDELKSVAKDAGAPEEAVYEILHLILKDAGLKPAQLATAPQTASSGAQSSKPIASGQPVTAAAADKNEQLLQQILQALGELKGMSADAAAKKAAEAAAAGATPEKATDEMVRAIAAMTKVKEENVEKIYAWLQGKGHIVVGNVKNESAGRRWSAPLLLERARAYNSSFDDSLLCERWQALAGLPADTTLNEVLDAAAAAEISGKIKSGEIKDEDGLRAALSGDGGVLSSIKNALSKIFGSDASPDQISKFIDQLKDAGVVKDDGKLDSNKATADVVAKASVPGPDASGVPAAPEADKKKFAGLVAAAQKELKDINPDELTLVMAALDKIAAFDIKQ